MLFKSNTSFISLFTLCAVFCSAWVNAEIEVVEGEPVVVTEESRSISTRKPKQRSVNTQASNSNTTQSSSVSTELYLQVQAMREELMQLRGQVEQQGFELEQLRQRRKDDYLDFDRRLSEMGASGGAKTSSNTYNTGSSAKPAKTVVDPLPKPKATKPSAAKPVNKPKQVTIGNDIVRDDAAQYKAAYQLIKDQQFSEAKKALNAFVSEHPKSQYVPNAYFWLGELYYIDAELEKSKTSFIVLIEQYPAYRRVADAKFKLGRIYHQSGNNTKARQYLNSVINDHADSKAANPAREYLQTNLK